MLGNDSAVESCRAATLCDLEFERHLGDFPDGHSSDMHTSSDFLQLATFLTVIILLESKGVNNLKVRSFVDFCLF